MPRLKPKICIEYQTPSRSWEPDYVFARSSRRKGRRHPDLPERYKFARSLAEVISIKRGRDKNLLADEFKQNLEQWKNETGHLSSLRKAMAHPSYLRMIGLAKQSSGYEIERLLLNELATEPTHLFNALTAITGENPVKPEDDFDASVTAWLKWGKERGII